MQFGIWSYQFWTIATSVGGSVIFETCHRYPSSVEVDSNWKAARAFGTCKCICIQCSSYGIFILVQSTHEFLTRKHSSYTISVAIIFGGIFLFANLISACMSPLRKTARLEAPAFLLAGIFQGLSLLLLNSSLCNNNTLVAALQRDAANLGNVGVEFPDTCSISTGAKCAISAIVFWFVAAITSYVCVKAEKKEEESNAAVTEPLIPGENL